MNRLTTKIKGSNNYCEFELKNAKYKNLFELSSNREIENYVNTDLTIAIDKLGQLEDIEKEIGIDLITLFKALKNGVWTNQEQTYGDAKQGKIRFFQVRLLLGEKSIGCIHNSIWKGKEVIRTLYLKNYGKTWALTKEELEYGND